MGTVVFRADALTEDGRNAHAQVVITTPQWERINSQGIIIEQLWNNLQEFIRADGTLLSEFHVKIKRED